MTIKRRVEQLEKAGYGAKPPFAVAFQDYIRRVRTNSEGEPEEFVEVGPVEYSIPDGPLGSGKELHIKATELAEEFRGRIQEAYLDIWGCSHHWVEVHPDHAGL